MDDHTRALVEEQHQRIATIDKLMQDAVGKPAVLRGLAESRQDAVRLITSLEKSAKEE